MQDVVIVTGSGHGLPEKIIKEYGIVIFPFGIHIGDEGFRDGVDITPEKMIKMIYEKKIVPKTSAPTIGDLVNILEPIKNEGKPAVFVLMSSKLSAATYESLDNAKKKVGVDIEIIDTMQAAPGKELIVIEAAKLAKAGKSREEVINYTKKVVARTNTILGLPDLKYLHLGGRIGKAKVLMGSMMKVIPIIAIRDMEGMISPVGRARNIFQVNQKIVDTMKEDLKKFNANKVKSIVIGHADNKEAAQSLKKIIEENINCEEMLVMEFGCAAIVHLGPKAWGAGYYIE
ncbi:MAG: DegV family protein [Actinobacteria bacterium]|nr:DegV family protein [Actinomycetota bacterium]